MKKILLTIGGSSDIGMAAIEDLITSYDRIIVHYNHMNEKLDELCEMNKCIVPIKADLSVENGCQRLIAEVNDVLNGDIPTHIIHFPAIKFQAKRFHKIQWNTFDEELNVSLKSAIMVLGEYLPHMVKNKYGKIVIMLSDVINGIPPKYSSDYVIIKEALYGLVKALAIEYAEHGIYVNGVSPVLVKTKFVENMHEIQIEENAKMSLTGKNLLIGDIIPVIRFLLSDSSDGISGQNVSVNFGRQ